MGYYCDNWFKYLCINAFVYKWVCGVVVSTFVCHRSNPGRAMKFGIANLYINSALKGSWGVCLFVCLCVCVL